MVTAPSIMFPTGKSTCSLKVSFLNEKRMVSFKLKNNNNNNWAKEGMVAVVQASANNISMSQSFKSGSESYLCFESNVTKRLTFNK